MQTRALAGYEHVYELECAGSRAFIAIHAALRGRAFGGVRIRAYASDEHALTDALALAEAMTRKVVLAGIDGGGAKSVLRLPPPHRRAEAIHQLGRFIDSLGGRYQCGGDYGFTAADEAVLRAATRHVACGDLAEATARSVELAIFAAADPRVVALQGLGAVGRPLARRLLARGVRVIAADPTWPEDLVPGDTLRRVDPAAIYGVDCDVFAPCAHGGVLDASTIPRLRAALVCGAANNPFAAADDVDRLDARGVAYIPDVIANAGATIVGASNALGEAAHIDPRFAAIPPLIHELLDRSRRERRSTHWIAHELADQRIAALRRPA
jgi:leucine dehydrogenase